MSIQTQLSNNTLSRAYDKACIEQKRNQSRPVWLIKIIDIFARLLSFLMNHSSHDRRSFIRESITHILSLFKEQKININDINDTINIVDKFKNVATNAQLNDLDKLKKKFDEIKNQPRTTQDTDLKGEFRIENLYKEDNKFSVNNPMHQSYDGKKGKATYADSSVESQGNSSNNHEVNPKEKQSAALQTPNTRKKIQVPTDSPVSELILEMEGERLIGLPIQLTGNPNHKPVSVTFKELVSWYLTNKKNMGSDNTSSETDYFDDLLDVFSTDDELDEKCKLYDHTELNKFHKELTPDTVERIQSSIKLCHGIFKQPKSYTDIEKQKFLKTLKTTSPLLFGLFFEPWPTETPYFANNVFVFEILKNICDMSLQSKNVDKVATEMIFSFAICFCLFKPTNVDYNTLERLNELKDIINDQQPNASSSSSRVESSLMLLNVMKNISREEYLESYIKGKFTLDKDIINFLNVKLNEKIYSHSNDYDNIFQNFNEISSLMNHTNLIGYNKAKASSIEPNTPTKVTPGYPPSMRVPDRPKNHGKSRLDSENYNPNLISRGPSMWNEHSSKKTFHQMMQGKS